MAKSAAAPLTVKVINGRLLIDAPLSAPALSASGKSYVIASTHGNMTTDAEYEGNAIILGLNAYTRA